MKPIILVLALALAPIAAAAGHLAAPQGLKIEEDNQVLRISWDAVPGAAGYYVYVHADGQPVLPDPAKDYTADVEQPSTTYRGTNGRSYAIQVAAHDAAGDAGPRSFPAAGAPRLDDDGRYLAIGLVVVWVGLWGYVLLFARLDRVQRERAGRIHAAKRRSK